MRAICDEFESHGYRRVGAASRRRGSSSAASGAPADARADLQPRRRLRSVTTTDSDHDRPIFSHRANGTVVDAPNQLWVADITYIAIEAGSSIWPPSSTPGRAERSATRSAGRSMPD